MRILCAFALFLFVTLVLSDDSAPDTVIPELESMVQFFGSGMDLADGEGIHSPLCSHSAHSVLALPTVVGSLYMIGSLRLIRRDQFTVHGALFLPSPGSLLPRPASSPINFEFQCVTN